MVEKRPFLDALSHGVLLLGVLVIAFPIYLTLVASTHSTQDIVQSPMPLWIGDKALETYQAVWNGEGMLSSNTSVARMMWVSLVSATTIAIGKIAISILSAFAIVYFRFRMRMAFFWAVFITLMLPVEVRISPTYQVIANFGMLNSYIGLTVPLIASATATFLFRQFFLTIPDELLEAARIDGAGPMRFFFDILLPLAKTSMAALFVIQFIYGWNQYLWPLLVITDNQMLPIVVGIKQLIGSGGDAQTEWNRVMATAMLALLPPTLIVLTMQRWFVKSLVETEK